MIELRDTIKTIPKNIKKYNCKISGKSLIFFEDKIKINEILKVIEKNKMEIADINIESSSLEDIFVKMVKNG